MRYRLLSRDRPIPNGVSVYDQHTGYRAPAFASFSAQCDGVQQARVGNPAAVKRYNLKTDRASIEDFVDSFLAKVCAENGWGNFITTGASESATPFLFPRPARERVARVAAAGVVSVEWIASGAEAVPVEQSTKRAETCSKCPLNEAEGDWLSLFTVPVARAVRKALEARSGMKLSTPFDAQLGICGACDCVEQLMVHMPLEKKLGMMSEDDEARLHPDCWILKEQAK